MPTRTLNDLLLAAAKAYQQQDYIHAAELYEMLAARIPAEFPQQLHIVVYNLATCYLQLQLYQKAHEFYQYAITIKPDDVDSYYNLGVIALKKNQFANATEYFHSVLKYDPNHWPALTNLAVIAQKQGESEQAIHYYQRAQQLQPTNTMIQYSLQALLGQTSFKHAPENYIQSLFDDYASHFEQHVAKELNYNLPTILQTTLASLNLKKHSLQILELGCGTGLCGSVLKTYASNLIGIDLSKQMLNEARNKQIYNQLFTLDITTDFTPLLERTFDMIVAADTLVYIGDLQNLFANCFQLLHPNGLFIFNTEIAQEADYQLKPSARFAHSKEYLIKLAEQTHFKLMHYSIIAPRSQDNQPVQCHWLVLRK